MSPRLMHIPILLRCIAQVLLLNHLPSQDLESGDTTKRGGETFPWLSLMKIYIQGGKGWKSSSGDWWGLDY